LLLTAVVIAVLLTQDAMKYSAFPRFAPIVFRGSRRYVSRIISPRGRNTIGGSIDRGESRSKGATKPNEKPTRSGRLVYEITCTMLFTSLSMMEAPSFFPRAGTRRQRIDTSDTDDSNNVTRGSVTHGFSRRKSFSFYRGRDARAMITRAFIFFIIIVRQRQRAEKRVRRPRSLSAGTLAPSGRQLDGDQFVQQMTSFSTHGIANRLINFYPVFTLITRR